MNVQNQFITGLKHIVYIIILPFLGFNVCNYLLIITNIIYKLSQ